jgi:hypothetical protein
MLSLKERRYLKRIQQLRYIRRRLRYIRRTHFFFFRRW